MILRDQPIVLELSNIVTINCICSTVFDRSNDCPVKLYRRDRVCDVSAKRVVEWPGSMMASCTYCRRLFCSRFFMIVMGGCQHPEQTTFNVLAVVILVRLEANRMPYNFTGNSYQTNCRRMRLLFTFLRIVQGTVRFWIV